MVWVWDRDVRSPGMGWWRRRDRWVGRQGKGDRQAGVDRSMACVQAGKSGGRTDLGAGHGWSWVVGGLWVWGVGCREGLWVKGHCVRHRFDRKSLAPSAPRSRSRPAQKCACRPGGFRRASRARAVGAVGALQRRGKQSGCKKTYTCRTSKKKTNTQNDPARKNGRQNRPGGRQTHWGDGPSECVAIALQPLP